MMENGMSAADMAAIMNNDGNGFGGANAWFWIVVLFLFGWGGNGFGGRSDNAQMATEATNANIQRGFDNQNIMQRFDTISQNQTNAAYENANLINKAIYDNAQLINNATTQMNNGFNGIDKSICQSTWATTQAMNNGFNDVTQGINNLSHQISDGVCAIKTQMLQDKYDDLLNQYNISVAANANAVQTQNILGAIGSWYAKPPYAPPVPLYGTQIA